MRSILRGHSLTKISYVIITAKGDFPYFGRSNLHLFEPTLECLKRQTMVDIEWVIVDARYEERKDYFKNLDLPFAVKHVPAKNIWLDNKLPSVSTQFNKGVIHADGELLFFGADGFMFESDFFEKVWSRYQSGYFPWAWYLIDWSCTPEITSHNYVQGMSAKDLGLSYNFSGVTGEKVVVDQRYYYFKDKDVDYMPTWTWFYCTGSVSLEAMLKINGFDQSFDGDKTLMDVDLGSRLDMARYGIRAALYRDLYMVRAATEYALFEYSPTIKCNYALIQHSRNFGRYEANRHIIEDFDVDWIKNVYCEGLCGSREFCKKNHPWQYPFQHKKAHDHPNSSQECFDFWKEHQELVDLKAERKLRKDGIKYQEGTFIGSR